MLAAKTKRDSAMPGWLDLIEGRAAADLALAARPDVAKQCGVHVDLIGTTWVTSFAAFDVLAFNRAIGFGVATPASAPALDAVVRFFSRAGAPPIFLPLHPAATPANLPQIVTARGFRPHNNWVKLSRNVEAVPRVLTDLRPVAIGSEHADAYGAVITQSFGFPAAMRGLFAGLVARPSWKSYLAFAGDRPVAAAAMFLNGNYAWIGFGSTLTEFRGRGGQQALTALRIADAAAIGCTHVVVETAEETHGRPVASYRNMRRLGFEVAYVRPNYVFDREYAHESV